ncbi:unnamed protein product [Cochlearia groenlandica]
MDNLLCDESWLSESLSSPEYSPNFHPLTPHGDDMSEITPAMAVDEATVDEAISIDLEKASRFRNHGVKFVDFLYFANLTYDRSQAVQWLIQTRNRLNLSYDTIFSATDNFDRFVYATGCYEWTKWMVELVAVTSLWIASKFNKVTPLSLYEIQMEGLDHMFHHKTIYSMEVLMLEILQWRVNSVTTYSFSEILVSKIGLLGDESVKNDITNHLLEDLRDCNMLRYAPTVVATAAVWNVLEQIKRLDANFGSIMNLFGQEHKENVVKCVEEKKTRNMDDWYSWSCSKPCEGKGFMSLLLRGEEMNMTGDYNASDLYAIFHIISSKGFMKKRDRDNNTQELARPAKRANIVMSN